LPLQQKQKALQSNGSQEYDPLGSGQRLKIKVGYDDQQQPCDKGAVKQQPPYLLLSPSLFFPL